MSRTATGTMWPGECTTSIFKLNNLSLMYQTALVKINIVDRCVNFGTVGPVDCTKSSIEKSGWLRRHLACMMASSNGNIFRVASPLWWESTGHRWIPLTRASYAGLLRFSLICGWINEWANNREAGDLRHRRAHYDVTAIILQDTHYPVVVECQ